MSAVYAKSEVEIRSIPDVTNSTDRHAQFRKSDSRGDIAIFYRGATMPIGSAEIVTCIKGSVRGNHYHKNCIEHLYVVTGKVILSTAKIVNEISQKNENPQQTILETGMIAIIPAGICHAIKAIADSTLIALSENGDSLTDRVTYQFVN